MDAFYDRNHFITMKSLFISGALITFLTTSFIKCSGEGGNSQPHPGNSASSSSGWIENVLRDSPSDTGYSLQYRVHSPSVASPIPSAHQSWEGIQGNTVVPPLYTHGIVLAASSSMGPRRKYTLQEGDRKTKEANWRTNDHERWVRHASKKALRNRLLRKGLVSLIVH